MDEQVFPDRRERYWDLGLFVVEERGTRMGRGGRRSKVGDQRSFPR